MDRIPLFWSRRGEIACLAHAPEMSSPRWSSEGWKGIALDGRSKRRYQCQHCHDQALRRSPPTALNLEDAAVRLRQLATSASPLQAIHDYLEPLPTAALVADDHGRYIGANTAACRLTDFSREELLRRSVMDLTPPEDLRVEEILWNAFVRSDYQRGSYALLRKDGRVVIVRYDAFANIGPGIHVSFLTASTGVARPVGLADLDRGEPSRPSS